MLAERLLTTALRRENEKVLNLDPHPDATIPGPEPGGRYMLYAHVPFCERLCPYCSFNRFPFEEDVARGYFRRLREELRIIEAMGYDFESLYVGGGTPTILVDELTATIDLARELFSIREVSCETNPNHLIERVIEPLTERVQRFSVGVQSFDDGLLKQMDRYDKYGSGAEILERLQDTADRFHSLNVDMIFNFPSQTEAILRDDLERVKESGCNQVTFYPLMTSEAVRRQLAETIGAVDYKREHRYYGILYERLSERFEPASAWTFSRKGGGMIDEYIVDYEQYVGAGSGSFSYLGGALYVNTFSVRRYDDSVDAGEMPTAAVRRFGRWEQMAYRFMMELFGLELDKERFERDFGVSVRRGLWREYAFFKAVRAFDVDDEKRLTLTPKGRYLLVAMMREFFAGVNNFRDQARQRLPEAERALLFGEGAACASPGAGHGPPGAVE